MYFVVISYTADRLYTICLKTQCFFFFFSSILQCNLNINKFTCRCFSLHFSTKYLKSLAKSGESPFFLHKDGKNPIFRYIYELLNDGIRGATKKDAVTTILGDIAVKEMPFFTIRSKNPPI